MMYTLTIQSETKNLKHVEPFLSGIAKQQNIAESVYHNAVVVLTEAVNNAIVHGNRLDSSKIVEISGQVTERRLELKVEDQGEGFEMDALPDPLHPDNLLRESGRGVFLIQALSDSVEYISFKGGTAVKISLNLDKDGEAAQ